MVDFNMYGVYASLREIRDELQSMRAEWLLKYPTTLTDVDFTRENEVFYKTHELKNRIRELDTLLRDMHETSKMLYDISKQMEALVAQCKVSKLTTLTHISTIESADGDIKAAIARQEQKEREERERNKFVEDVGRGKRKAHRR
jgi:hypothetical protein